MHDLRRRALERGEAGKTLSRKQRTRVTSGLAPASAPSSLNASLNNSRAASRTNSRPPSRHDSDDEDDTGLSDSTFSLGSLDAALEEDIATTTGGVGLMERVEAVIGKDKKAKEARERDLAALAYVLTHSVGTAELEGRELTVVRGLLKVVGRGTEDDEGEREAVLGLRALAAVFLTSPTESLFAATVSPLKRTIVDALSNTIKTAGLHALGLAAYYGGAGEPEIVSTMRFLLDIIQSDGGSVEATDEGEVVVAALEEWGFLATRVRFSEDEDVEEAMDAFIDQLESSDASVQVATGENIALVFEKSRIATDELDSDDESDYEPDDAADEDADDIDSEEEDEEEKGYRKIYTPIAPHTMPSLESTLSDLATTSARSLNAATRRRLHSSFTDILHSVSYPTHGPRYSTALDHNTGRELGSRLVVRLGGPGKSGGEVRVNKWWKLHRLQALRRVLQGGLSTHLLENESVFQTIPVLITRK
ncbi:hypothetical protein P152DRAFT_370349, partial [Eremomyces bilateralis CBS 781.70]